MLHRDDFVKTVEQALRDTCRVRTGEAILLAVSGGADSVALLRAVAIIAERPHWRLRLHVAHVNHHLRAAAQADAAFVAELADKLKLPFDLLHINPASERGNLEDAARRLRYAALQQLAGELEMEVIATAHHGDDQLETMLMRLIRGASVRGLAAMSPRRQLDAHTTLIRPMLRTDHATAVAFLERLGQGWREDATNRETSRWRARLRADVLPVLRELKPDAAVKAADTADRLRDAARLVDRQVRRTIDQHVTTTPAGERQLDRAVARRLPPALLRSVLRALLIEAGARPDAIGRRVLNPMVRAARDSSGERRRFEVAGGVQLTVTASTIRFLAPPPFRSVLE